MIRLPFSFYATVHLRLHEMILRGTLYVNVLPLSVLLRRISTAPFLIPPQPQIAWISKAIVTAFLLLPSENLTALRTILSPSVAFETLRRLPGDADQLLDFYNFTRTEFEITHSMTTYKFIVALLLKSRRVDDAVKLFDEMTECNHMPDGSFLGFIIDSLVDLNNLDAALRLLAKAPNFECKIRSYSSNNLFTALISNRRVNDVVEFFSKHLGSPYFVFDTCSFNIIIKCLCKSGEIDRAFELLGKMRSFECLPDTITYNILVDGLCRANRVDRGHEILRRIQEDGICVPNVVTFTIVISGYCKVGKMDNAYGVLTEMIGCGIKPSRVTYNVLIDGYGKCGNMKEAILMYDKMMVCGCPPDVVTFTSIIDGYCKRGQINDARIFWSEMVMGNISPNIYTYGIMINALCKKNQLSEARALLNEVNERTDIVPSKLIYNPVIDALCKAGNVDEANLVFSDMHKRKCVPDKFTYTILIIGHCMKGRMSEAIALFDKMLDSGCAPDNVTVNSLISCLLKAGMPQQANHIMHITKGSKI